MVVTSRDILNRENTTFIYLVISFLLLTQLNLL